jgi:hypothetical protein
MLAMRTRETLEWHFGSTLKRGDAWIITATSGGLLTGYAVIDRQDNPALGLRRMRLADFQALHGYEALIRPVLAWMLRRCSQEQIHVAEIVGDWLERLGAPGTSGRYRRRLHSWLFYYLASDGSLREQLRNPEIWAPSSYDGDSSL